ncbi:MAG: hypothetical protein WCX16_02335 [Candidatus Omnitrophota bacterium]
MRKQFLLSVAAIMLGVGIGQLAFAEETKTLFGDAFKKADIQVTGSTSIYSKYMWRGFRLYDGYVNQPSININAFKDWNLNVWGSYGVSNYTDAPNANETDTTLTYTHKFENLKLGSLALNPVSLTLGYIYYDFSGAGTFSKESILGLGYDTFLSPTVTWYHDHGRESQGGGDGDYLVLNLAKSLEIVPSYGVTLDLSGHVGYNKHLFIRGEGGDVLLTAGVTVPLTKNLKFSPSVNWNAPFGGVAKEVSGDEYIDRKAEFFWGTTLTYNF